MISEQIGLDLLRTYVAVCQQGSLSRVAAQTGRTQSALSMQIRRLESLLERHLFRRTGRGVVPTAEGEIFLGYATRILALSDEALARLRQAEISGSVRIGLAEEVANAALPAALGRLHRAHPEIHLDVAVEHSTALGRIWGESELDAMIAPTSVVVADALTTWNVDLQWACAVDHVPDETRPLDVVAFAAPCLWRRRMIDALTAIGREYRVTFTSQSVTGLQAAIENGLGVGLLPPDAVRPGTMRTLQASTGVPEPLTVQYGLYAHDRRPRVVDATIDVLLEAISATGSRN
jgi:DNA-binding transcriptional LysR family regulator